MVSGETADISPFAEYKWYEWVMFRDTSVSFPEDYMVRGRDLGPAIDIGPAMSRKIIKQNGQIVYRSTVRSLTPDEIADPIRIKERDEFDEALKSALGEPLTEEDLAGDPDYETPELEPYDDKDDRKTPLVQDIDKADADTHDKYVGAQVKLPNGDKVQTGKVIGRKRDRDGEAISVLA